MPPAYIKPEYEFCGISLKKVAVHYKVSFLSRTFSLSELELPIHLTEMFRRGCARLLMHVNALSVVGNGLAAGNHDPDRSLNRSGRIM
jgi:hypothetical protein